jgi:hypothetical protein
VPLTHQETRLIAAVPLTHQATHLITLPAWHRLHRRLRAPPRRIRPCPPRLRPCPPRLRPCSPQRLLPRPPPRLRRLQPPLQRDHRPLPVFCLLCIAGSVSLIPEAPHLDAGPDASARPALAVVT